MTENLAITKGAKNDDTKGSYLVIPKNSSVEALAGTLLSFPKGEFEGWWSPYVWRDNKRSGERWLSACGVAIDIDFKFKKKSKAPLELQRDQTPEEVAALTSIVTSEIPISLWHPTPGGGRVVSVFSEQCHDSGLIRKATRGLGELVNEAIREKGLSYAYWADPAAYDLARFFYTPNALVKDVYRNANVIVLKEEPFTPDYFAKFAPPEPPPPQPRPITPETEAFVAAVQQWNNDHLLNIPRGRSLCPVCKDDNLSLGHLPDNDQRWYCFSSCHEKVGLKGELGFHGNALDLDAFHRGLTPVQVLKDDGYWPPKPPVSIPPVPPAPPPENPVSIDTKRRPLRNNSYLSALTLIRDANAGGARDITGKKKIAFNEMSGLIEFGGESFETCHASFVRGEIERLFVGGIDDENREIGLKLSQSDVERAIEQVSKEKSYHPVREYFNKLSWAKQKLLHRVPGEILGAENTSINQAIITKFFISAVARVMEPGCKVDTVLILVGKQGKLKSTFFEKIASPWFIDSNVDIRNKDAFSILRTALIFEWGELEKIMKHDMSLVKSLISSRVDTYRPPYGKGPVQVPRSGIIVGTTNEDEFLTDETGARRFWPIKIATEKIKHGLLTEWRDQLWAEAIHLYKTWVSNGRKYEECPWWLTDSEERELEGNQKDHRVSDAWEDKISAWIALQNTQKASKKFTTAQVLAEALVKDIGQWTRGDEMRVAKALKTLGYERKTDPTDTHRKVWSPVEKEKTTPARLKDNL